MKKKIESSKKIIITCYVILIAVLIATYVAIFMYREVNDQIVLAIVGLVASANGFYFWKARAENTIKIAKEYDADFNKVQQKIEGLEFIGGDNGQFNV